MNFGGLVDHVVIREDEALFVHDYAGTEATLGVRAIVGRIEEAIEEVLEGIVASWVSRLRLWISR